MRASGILLPVFSLPSPGGIGCFSKEAFQFIDYLAASGQQYWQILPLNPAGGWYSPYMPLSCFAGDPVFIDPYTLMEEGLLTQEELDEYLPADSANAAGPANAAAPGRSADPEHAADPDHIDYEALLPGRMHLLYLACSRFQPGEEYESFCKENAWWMEDYALYMVIRETHNGAGHREWEHGLKFREPEALAAFAAEHEEQLRFVHWTQYTFLRQWAAIRRYAKEHNIKIIGDIPIYVSPDSADCWAYPSLFRLTASLEFKEVAGVPPDAFSEEGQMWGNPLYNWKLMEEDGFSWWRARLEQCFWLYDLIRLDHTRGFQAYFAIPKGAASAAEGRWRRGPGMKFFRAIEQYFPKDRFIAEDLGHITPAVRRMVREAGLPGMKVLQFAFDNDPDNPYLPENIKEPCVLYTGTHDNDTTRGWYASLDLEEREKITTYIRRYLGGTEYNRKAPVYGASQAALALMEIVFSSRAELCIVPMQDLLLLDSSARMNTPGTVGGNWSWRMRPDAFQPVLCDYLLRLTRETGRLAADVR